MATEAQIQANKSNAQLSTGPENTKNTRLNALKHGLCAKSFIKEEEKIEFDDLLKEISADLQPKNSIQFILVERIAIALLDLQRIENVERIKTHNQQTKNKINALGQPMFLDVELSKYTVQEKKEKEKLEAQILDCNLPDEIISRYKSEAENRLYKALKAWKEMDT